jgi:hypothetical protein
MKRAMPKGTTPTAIRNYLTPLISTAYKEEHPPYDKVYADQVRNYLRLNEHDDSEDNSDNGKYELWDRQRSNEW